MQRLQGNPSAEQALAETEQGAAWRDIAEPLARQGYCVVAPDLRGPGRSDRVGPGGSYNLLDFLADLDRVIDRNRYL